MFFGLTFLLILTIHTMGKDAAPSENGYLLGLSKMNPLFNLTNLFDGPASVSNTATEPTANKKPTLEQIRYYIYYTTAVNCPYQVLDLSCFYCEKIKNDIVKYEVLNNKIHDTSALVTLSENREEVVVSFRSTENIWNIVLDYLIVNINLDEKGQIKIHTGFYIATMSLYNEVVQLVGTLLLENPSYKLVITGHSLGAAMARVTEFFLLKLNQFPETEIEVYTYGEPRSGNKHYADFLNAQRITTARITNKGDIIPHLPPTSILGTNILSDYYVHPHTEFYINGEEEDEQMFCSQSVYEDPDCSNSLGPLYEMIRHFNYFDVNHGECLGDYRAFAAMPFGIYHPVGTIPPLPKPIQTIVGGFGSKIVEDGSSIIGRYYS